MEVENEIPYHKKYYNEHKDKMKQLVSLNGKTYITCECGKQIKKSNKTNHLRTKSHKKRIEEIQQKFTEDELTNTVRNLVKILASIRKQ